MIFTTKAEYGVRLLVELGRHESGDPVSLKAISEAEGLPLAYLERIVALLKRAGIVESTRGAHGGYRLARDADSITMDEVIVALEGAVAPMQCFVDDTDSTRVLCSHSTDRGQGCATRLLWMRVQGGVMEKLAQTRLSELVAFSTRLLWMRVQGGVMEKLAQTRLSELVAFSTRTPDDPGPTVPIPAADVSFSPLLPITTA